MWSVLVKSWGHKQRVTSLVWEIRVDSQKEKYLS